MRSCPRGSRRSVDRGAHRPAIEPRKLPILGADTVHMVEGNTFGRVIASARATRRGQRPWHVQTFLAREPGDLAIDRSATAAGEDLHARVHRGAYRALPARRVYIPKPDGRQRPLAVAAL